ncbi:hypothetical protein [Prescottella equi]|uniref:hypothetical protein n=1 Tax=Rhodococcus hoagii TaxID=43767 RepID=UPI000D0FC886|nr:hypothetical protein [Prescottella equi]AVP71288.1 hypothetical protein C7H75_24715 [Prescottella equi]
MGEPEDARFDADTRIAWQFDALEQALALAIDNASRPIPEDHGLAINRCMAEQGDLILEVFTARPIGGEWSAPQRRVLDGRSLFDETMFSEPD